MREALHEPFQDTAWPPSTQLGAVVIGRNEGERLQRVPAVVVSSCRCGGVRRFRLERRFGAMGARLAGRRGGRAGPRSAVHRRARAQCQACDVCGSIAPSIAFVQFVDGDCEMSRVGSKLRLGILNVASRRGRRCRPAARALPEQVDLQLAVRSRMGRPSG